MCQRRVIEVDFKNIEAVALVQLYNGFTKASQASGIPVSTLSKRVARLEDELDVRLFDRSTASDSVSLTEHGQVLVPELQQIVNTMMFLKQHLEDVSGEGDDRFSIGMLPMLTYKQDNILLAEFQVQHPETEVCVVVRSSSEVVRLLQQGSLDCAFIIGSAIDGVRGWESRLLMTDEFELIPVKKTSTVKVALSEEDSLAGKEAIHLSELRNRTLIFNRWAGEARRAGGGYPWLFEECGVDPAQFDIFYEDFTNREYLFDLISYRRCAIPLLSFEDMDVPGISFVDLAGWNNEVMLYFVYRKSKSGALSKLVELIQSKLGCFQ